MMDLQCLGVLCLIKLLKWSLKIQYCSEKSVMVSLIVLWSDLVSHQVIALTSDLNRFITCCSVVFPVPLKLVHGLFQRSTQYTPTVVLSEKASPHLKAENSFTSYTEGTVSIYSEGAYKSNV